jgi:acyl-coenzyme A thioesterase PaaI-like protein
MRAMPEPQPTSRSCFVCGRDNPLGLHTRWESDRASGEARCRVTLPEAFNSYPGVVHGGIVAALLDEAMVRALLVEGGFDDLLVTASMELSFRKATPTGQPISVVARIARKSGSRARAEAEVRLADGTVTARAEALLAKPTPEVAAGWAAERSSWRTDEP